ncbi:hypothetical protein [Pedococcus aerophilus]|uniref:hypothetical protein n=1 Tax=Pedococcus aerophilus TaxID=436356 RepID=UPI0031E075B9
MRRLLLVLLLATSLLTACAASDGTPTSGDGDTAISSSSGDTETFADPEPEPTTPDVPEGESTDDNPAIQVARLPVGGGSVLDPGDPTLQCAQVNWVGSNGGEIPQGTGVELIGVAFDPAVFETSGDGCGSERPSCLGYVFRASALQCDLAVRVTGDVPPDTRPTVGFSGLVFCPDDQSESCRRFVEALGDQEQQQVTLEVPAPPEPATEPTTEPTTDPATEPTSDPPTVPTEGG